MHSQTRDAVPARSYLYVPGDQKNRLERAKERGADALILDLEDSVALQNKPLAREIVTAWLAEDGSADATQLWIRVNAASPADDIAVVSASVAGVMVPGAEPESLRAIDRHLSDREKAVGLPAGSLAIIALIETGRGLLSAPELASMPRVTRLAIGRADLAGELGLGLEAEDAAFESLLLQLVVASAAARIAPPMAPTSTDFKDLDALKASTERLMKLGFRGRSAVHPAQLAIINQVFTPTAAEVAQARDLIAAFEKARQDGSGVTTDERGRMVDVAVVRSARDIVARADAHQGGPAYPARRI